MAFVFSDVVEIVGPHMRKNRPAHVSVKIVKQGDAHLRFFQYLKWIGNSNVSLLAKCELNPGG